MKKSKRGEKRAPAGEGIQGVSFNISRVKTAASSRVFVVCESGVSIFTLAQIWRRGVGAIGILVGDGSGVGHPAHEQHDATAVVPDEEQERMVHLEVLVAE